MCWSNVGPQRWKDHYAECGGKLQSPVAIWPKDITIVHTGFEGTVLTLSNYSTPIEYAVFNNNGHTGNLLIITGEKFWFS